MKTFGYECFLSSFCTNSQKQNRLKKLNWFNHLSWDIIFCHFFSAGNWMLVLTNSAVLNTTFTKTEETNNFVSERRDFGKNLKTIIENNWRFIKKEIEDFENIVFWGCRWESDGIVYVLDLKYYNTTLHVVFTWALGDQEKQSWMNLSTIFIEKHW